ncbi:MAG: hypothetical protein OXI41_11015 [Chloroflexota bacterium]|nr:hypothetical protein [Chloroflexota bacterium]MDE2896354.1 hypothetical protein [Chloroflexota bacterium]
MSAETTSRHQEWREGLDPSTRAEVEAEISYYKPNGVWEFEEVEPDDDWEPSGRMGLTVHFSSDEIEVLSKAFGASVQAFEIMHDSVMAQARAVLEERGESDSIAAAD